MTKSALKVKHILKKIETHRPLSKNKKLTAEVTQTELNAYIRYRLAQEIRRLIVSKFYNDKNLLLARPSMERVR